jgi:hypothetical protein
MGGAVAAHAASLSVRCFKAASREVRVGGRVAAGAAEGCAVSAETAAGETTGLEADMVKELKEDEGLLSKERLRGRTVFQQSKNYISIKKKSVFNGF